VFSVSVIVQSNCHILQFLRQIFNVSTLLLDDALKPATPLTNGVINDMLRQFAPRSVISQGSVATHLKYREISSDDIIANFLMILTVTPFRKSLIFHKVKAYKNIVSNTMGHPVQTEIYNGQGRLS